jgi:hypothetical protein
VSVTEGGPLTSMVQAGNSRVTGRAKPGDVITAVDGKAVDSFPAFFEAMERARMNFGKLVVTVQDGRTGTRGTWIVQAELQPAGPPTAGKRQVHFLLCGLTDDKSIGEGIKVSLKNIKTMIGKHVEQGHIGSIREIRGGDCNAVTILRAVDELRVDSQDTVFCYYLGHGAYDTRRALGDPSRGHFFDIDNADLMRKQLFDRLRSKGARLTVLISDTCNVPRAAMPAGRARLSTVRRERPAGYTPLEKLLLFYRGEIDLSASSWDECSWFNPVVGGWFTAVLCRVLPWHSDWTSMLADLSKKANDDYHAKRQMILRTVRDPGELEHEPLRQLNIQPHMRPQTFQLQIASDPYAVASNRPAGTVDEVIIYWSVFRR